MRKYYNWRFKTSRNKTFSMFIGDNLEGVRSTCITYTAFSYYYLLRTMLAYISIRISPSTCLASPPMAATSQRP